MVLGEGADAAWNEDDVEVRRIVEAIRERGVWMNFKGGEIGIQWWGDIPNTGAMIALLRAQSLWSKVPVSPMPDRESSIH